MKTPATKGYGIAVLGGPDLVNALRLAGVADGHVVEAGSDAAAEVPRVLRGWVSGGKVGLILVGDGLTTAAAEVLASVRSRKGLLPVILEVPEREVTEEASAAYYKALSREFLGLDVVLEADEAPENPAVSNPS